MSELLNKNSLQNRGQQRDTPQLPWMEWEVGDRVVVRYREEDGGLRDALGYLVEREPGYVVIDAKRGRVRVEAKTMVVGRKVMPPKPLFTRKPAAGPTPDTETLGENSPGN